MTDLQDEINELENKLKQLKIKNVEKHKGFLIASSPIGVDSNETVKEITRAKEKSEAKAGLVKNTADGSTLEEDNVETIRIPTESIHQFDNMDECVCECHPKKYDCMNCYDHPVHLNTKRKPVTKPEYEARIMELIEQDKIEKKHWWKR